MLYNKAVHWLTILSVPYFVLVIPIFDYIAFQMIYIILKYFYYRGSAASKDIGYFIMVMMNCTQFYCLIVVSLWFIMPRQHGCGPIADGMSGWDPVEVEIRKRPWLDSCYSVITLFPILWLILCYVLLVGFLQGNKGDVLEQYSKDKSEEYGVIISE
mmetsp:Transcript_5649/g.8933  ORF Transcript_5649/g.8933 Transcript_5649/m.8933 type:complete len:157 (+) Transcript_5649:1846-2316(+)